MTSLTNAIDGRIIAKLSEIHICLPGRIESYDYTTQKASVKPLLKRVYEDDGEIQALPVIVDVPVIFARSGGASLTFPIAEGDGVLLIFAERSLDEWLTLGGDQAPVDPRKFDLTDAIAIPGLNSFNVDSLDPNGTDVTLQFADGKIVINPDGKIAIGKTEELLDLVDQMLDAILAMTQPLAPIPNPVATATPLVNAATFIQIKTDLDTIKGSL